MYAPKRCVTEKRKSQSQPPDTPMSSASDATKQELTAGLQMSITSQANAARSKPQACKVCGKMLSSGKRFQFIFDWPLHHARLASANETSFLLFFSPRSASSYYVHMKLHSGTKPFACTVSMYDSMRDAFIYLY